MGSPIRTLTRSFLLAAAAVLSVAQPTAWAQSGGLDRAILTASAPLTAAQTSALDEFVSRWTSTLTGSDDPAEVTAARNALTDPARDPSASPIFRRAFSGAVLAKIRPIVEGKDLRRAVNSLQVARFLRSPESVELISGRLATSGEPDAAKRLAASSVLAAAVTDADLSAVQCDGLVRDILAAAALEKDESVLVQQMKVLRGIAKRAGLPPATVDAALAAQVKVFAGLADAIAASPQADPRMASAARALVSMRNDWLELPRPQAAKLGPSLAPPVATIIKAAERHWDSARGDPERAAAYEIAVATSETLLRLVDRTMRPTAYPAPKPGAKDDEARVLANAWTASDRAAFAKEVARWGDIVKASPYGGK